MTEKNIFVYKLFLSLKISDFSLFVCLFVFCFFVKIVTPLKKVTPVFSSNPPLKVENLVGGLTPQQKGGGVHTMGQPAKPF